MNNTTNILQTAKVVTPPLNHDGIHFDGRWAIQALGYGPKSFFVVTVNDQHSIEQCSCKRHMPCLHARILCKYTCGVIKIHNTEQPQRQTENDSAPNIRIIKLEVLSEKDTKPGKKQTQKGPTSLVIPPRKRLKTQTEKKKTSEVKSISSSDEE